MTHSKKAAATLTQASVATHARTCTHAYIHTRTPGKGGGLLASLRWVTPVKAEAAGEHGLLSPGHATCRRESEEGEAGRVEERRLRESSHWSTKNRREGSGSGYKIQGGEREHSQR